MSEKFPTPEKLAPQAKAEGLEHVEDTPRGKRRVSRINGYYLASMVAILLGGAANSQAGGWEKVGDVLGRAGRSSIRHAPDVAIRTEQHRE